MKKTLRICLVAVLAVALVLGISSIALAATNDGSISVASGGASGAIGRDVYLNIKAPSSLPDGATATTWSYSVTGALTTSGSLDCSSTHAHQYTPSAPGTKAITVSFTCDEKEYCKKEIKIAASNSILTPEKSTVTYSKNLTVKVTVTNPCPDGKVTVSSGAPLTVLESSEGLSSYTIQLEEAANVNDTFSIKYVSSGGSFQYTETSFSIKKATETGPDTLSVKTGPKKTNYSVGEYFDPEGLVLELTMKDGSKQLITDGYLYEDRKFTATDQNNNVLVKIRYTVNGETLDCNCQVHCDKNTAAALSALHLNKGSMTLSKGTSDVIIPTAYPDNTKDITYTFASDKETVAKVNSEGVVTAVSDGNATITVTATAGTVTLTSNCYITVPKQDEIQSITISPKSFKLLVGDSTTLSCTVKPSTIVNPVITWKTSNADVCTVVDGQIKGIKAGTAMITASCNGFSSNTIITVVDQISDVVRIVNCKKGVNCRASASGSAKILGTAYLDNEYKLLGQSGSWYKIQYTSSKIGYVYKTFVETSDGKKYKPDNTSTPAADPNATPAPTTASKVTIINCTRRVYIKASASSSARTLGYAELGTTWSLKGKTSDGAWYVVDKNGENGYIQSKFCLVG